MQTRWNMYGETTKMVGMPKKHAMQPTMNSFLVNQNYTNSSKGKVTSLNQPETAKWAVYI